MVKNMIKKLTVCGSALLMLSSVGLSSVSANSSHRHSHIRTSRVDYRANKRFDSQLSRRYNRSVKRVQQLSSQLYKINPRSAKYRKLSYQYGLAVREENRLGKTEVRPQNADDAYHDYWTNAENKARSQATKSQQLNRAVKRMYAHRHQVIKRIGKRAYARRMSAMKHSIGSLDKSVGKFVAHFNASVSREDLAVENQARAMYRLPAYQHDEMFQKVANSRAKQTYGLYYEHHIDWAKVPQSKGDKIVHGWNGKTLAPQRLAKKLIANDPSANSRYSGLLDSMAENGAEFSLGRNAYANDLGGQSSTDNVYTPLDVARTVNMGYLYYDAHDQNSHRDSILNGSYDSAFPESSSNFDRKDNLTGVASQFLNFSNRMKLEATGVYFNPITQRGAIIEEFA